MTFPRDETELIKARATALFDDGRDMVPLAQARKQIKPAYVWAIRKLNWMFNTFVNIHKIEAYSER